MTKLAGRCFFFFREELNQDVHGEGLKMNSPVQKERVREDILVAHELYLVKSLFIFIFISHLLHLSPIVWCILHPQKSTATVATVPKENLSLFMLSPTIQLSFFVLTLSIF